MKTLIALLIALVLPGLSIAATQADKIELSRGYGHYMCQAEGSTGNCDKNLTPDLYAIVDDYETVTFFLTETGTGSSCDIYATNVEDRGTPLDDTTTVQLIDSLDDLAANKINSAPLTLANDKITFTDISFKYMWVKCTAVGTTTTVYMQGSIGPQRGDR